VELPAGSLWVPLEGENALRAAILLEPTAMYGLWQYPRLKALVAWDGTIPVLRVVEPRDDRGAVRALPARRRAIPAIERIDLVLVRLPFVAPFSISSAT